MSFTLIFLFHLELQTRYGEYVRSQAYELRLGRSSRLDKDERLRPKTCGVNFIFSMTAQLWERRWTIFTLNTKAEDVFNGRIQAQPGNEFHENIKILRAVVPDLKEADLRNEQRPAIYESLKRAERGLPKTHEELRVILADKKIICFSESPDNILMWAHYCENHTGAVVEFSYIEKYASVWGAAKPVRYMARMPLLADEETMFRSLTGQESIASPERFYDAVYVKAQDWAYEKEWRTLGGWDKSRQTEDIAFKRDEVTAVYLGCRMDDASRREIKKIVKKRYPHAVVHIGNKSARRFALEFAKAS